MAKYICPMCGEWNNQDQKYCKKCSTWLLNTNHPSKRSSSFFQKKGQKDYAWVIVLVIFELAFTGYFLFFQPANFQRKDTGTLLFTLSILNILIAFVAGLITLLRRRRTGATRLVFAAVLMASFGFAASFHSVPKKQVANLQSVSSGLSTQRDSETSNRLPSSEQEILSHLEEHQSTCSIPIGNLNSDDVKNEVENALKADEYLALSIRSYSVQITSFGSSETAVFSIDYWEDEAQYAAVQAGVKQVLKQITKPGMDDFTKEKAIHDYVVLHVAYDQSLSKHSAYDALYNGSAVCQGYTMLTYQLLRAAEIPNHIVIGTATNRVSTESHSWNEVQLNGKWYQLDTTWDDPVPDQEGRVLYNYFNLTNTEIARDHQWVQSGLPVADTDYIKVMESSDKPQDQLILKETGLNAEETEGTYTNFEQLQTVLANQKPGKYIFRFPYSKIMDFKILKLSYHASYNYQRDPRNPNYAIVNISIG
jgi:hypothetical protein